MLSKERHQTATGPNEAPQLNGKVERSHRSDQQPSYQLLSYKGDVDLEAKLDEWERLQSFVRPHGAHNVQTLTKLSERSYINPQIVPQVRSGYRQDLSDLNWSVLVYYRGEGPSQATVRLGDI
jgi:hypothetical protein